MQRIKDTLLEAVYAVIPITAVIIILQFALVRLPSEVFLQFLVGVIMVGAGLTLFLLGLQIGLLPMGEYVGAALPKIGKAWVVVFFGFLLGFIVTLAEPNVRILADQVDVVSAGVISKNLLIYTIAFGVAIFISLAMLRVILSIPIIYILIFSYGIIFLLAAIVPAQFLPVAFDAGGVTTGPLLVPFVLAMGVGIASVLGGKSASTDGFGLVALAFAGPILAVLLLGVIYG